MKKDSKDFLVRLFKKFQFLIGIQVLIASLWAFDVAFRPYLLKQIINESCDVYLGRGSSKIVFFATIYLSASCFMILLFRIYDYVWLKLNSEMKKYLGDEIMTHLMNQSFRFYHDNFSGSLANKVKETMSGLPDLIKLIINQFLSHAIAFSIASVVIAQIDTFYSVVFLGWGIVFILGSLLLSKKSQKLSKECSEVRSRVVGKIVDILSSVLNVVLFSRQSFERNSFLKHLDDYVKADQKRDLHFLKMFLFQGVSFVTYQGIVLASLIHDIQCQNVTPGDFALLMSVNISMIALLWSFSSDLMKATELAGSIKLGLEMFLHPIEVKEVKLSKVLTVKEGSLVFQNVYFKHKGQSENLFENINIHINGYTKVGLVGYSGAGKSTFIHLLLRLFDVQQGSILIDNQLITDVSLESLRNAISVIPQETSLFNRSLFENIHYGNVLADSQSVYQASKKALAHDFIMDLEMNYDSLVGERGVKLSGGQKQKIAIARAILKNAPILILDEATSQIDSLAEKEIQKVFWDLMENKTSLIIAHRLSTLIRMDRILVFDQGKIVQDGTHQQLLDQEGLYKTLWYAQVGGFLPIKPI